MYIAFGYSYHDTTHIMSELGYCTCTSFDLGVSKSKIVKGWPTLKRHFFSITLTHFAYKTLLAQHLLVTAFVSYVLFVPVTFSTKPCRMYVHSHLSVRKIFLAVLCLWVFWHLATPLPIEIFWAKRSSMSNYTVMCEIIMGILMTKIPKFASAIINRYMYIRIGDLVSMQKIFPYFLLY